MRWKQIQEGRIRIVDRFLLLPRCVAGQWRWLEWAKIVQKYDRSIRSWEDMYFMDSKENEAPKPTNRTTS